MHPSQLDAAAFLTEKHGPLDPQEAQRLRYSSSSSSSPCPPHTPPGARLTGTSCHSCAVCPHGILSPPRRSSPAVMYLCVHPPLPCSDSHPTKASLLWTKPLSARLPFSASSMSILASHAPRQPYISQDQRTPEHNPV